MFLFHGKGQPSTTSLQNSTSKIFFSHNARNIPPFSTPRQQQNYQPAMHNQCFNQNQPFKENRFNSFRKNALQAGNDLCYYHAIFGERAKKCNPLCSMANQNRKVLPGSECVRGEQNFLRPLNLFLFMILYQGFHF